MLKAQLDLLNPDFYQNPVPTLNTLREEHPVYWSEQATCWFVSRYADVKRLLHETEDARVSPHLITGYTEERPLGNGALARTIEGALISSDPPTHTRLRRHTAPALTPKSVRTNFHTLVEGTISDLMDRLVPGTTFDVVRDLSVPLPLIVICALVGIEVEDPRVLNEWAISVAPALEPLLQEGAIEQGDEGAAALEEFLRNLLTTEGPRTAEGTILHRVWRGMNEGTLTSEAEAIARLSEIVIAGTETTTTIIPAALEALAMHPASWSLLKSEPALVPSAVQEFLRFASPSALAARVAAVDIDLDGGTIRAGDPVQLVLMAANRDPRVFDAPDQLDITRNPNPHIAFGSGLHMCLGQNLARLEVESFLRSALSRWESFEVNLESVRRRPRIGVWGYSDFPTVFHAAS